MCSMDSICFLFFFTAAEALWKPQTLLRPLHQRPSWARAAAGEAGGAEPAAVRGSVPRLCHRQWSRGNQAVGPAGGKRLLTEQILFLLGNHLTTCVTLPFERTHFATNLLDRCSPFLSDVIPCQLRSLSSLTCYFPLASMFMVFNRMFLQEVTVLMAKYAVFCIPQTYLVLIHTRLMQKILMQPPNLLRLF